MFIGEFSQRQQTQTILKGERAEVKKPEDNLKITGEFAKRQRDEALIAEKRTSIRQTDNLRTEG